MSPYSKDALGQVVHGLRKHKGMTQEELGRSAGYRTGAGVAISRLESGRLRPSPERFAGLAAALGLTPAELEARALRPNVEHDVAASTEADGASSRADTTPGQRELNARKQRIEHEIGERARAITELSEGFNTHYDRACEEFLRPFVTVAARVEGAPPPGEVDLHDGDVTGASGVAGARPTSHERRSRRSANVSAVGAGAAGAAVGTAVLAGIVALPLVALVARGVIEVQRNRKQRREYAMQLDLAEAELAATASGVKALQDLLVRAAETLDYIATHAGHALNRWANQLGPEPTTWDALGPAEQQRYHDFIEVARAQNTIMTFDFPGILTARGRYQEDLIHHADEVLTGSDDAVRARF